MHHSVARQLKYFTSQVINTLEVLLVGNKTERVSGTEYDILKVLSLFYPKHIFQSAIGFGFRIKFCISCKSTSRSISSFCKV